MNESGILGEIATALDQLLVGEFPASLDCEGIADRDLKHLCETTNRLIRTITEAATFVRALSDGRLDIDPPRRNLLISPFKQLHSNLKHLTWQTQEIARGDLNQHVDFLGEFSKSFNEMIASLQEKRRLEEALKQANELLERQATTDALTGIPNRLKFNTSLEKEVNRARRYGIPLSLIMFDIDHFKHINDTFGHPVGDSVLRQLAERIGPVLRREDMFARWGGEEFVVLLPHTDLRGGVHLAERLRLIVENTGFTEAGRVTCSFGVSELREGIESASFLKNADESLYRAKTGGRNRVEPEQPC